MFTLSLLSLFFSFSPALRYQKLLALDASEWPIAPDAEAPASTSTSESSEPTLSSLLTTLAQKEASVTAFETAISNWANGMRTQIGKIRSEIEASEERKAAAKAAAENAATAALAAETSSSTDNGYAAAQDITAVAPVDVPTRVSVKDMALMFKQKEQENKPDVVVPGKLGIRNTNRLSRLGLSGSANAKIEEPQETEFEKFSRQINGLDAKMGEGLKKLSDNQMVLGTTALGETE